MLGGACFGHAYPAGSASFPLGPTVGLAVLGALALVGTRLGPVTIAAADLGVISMTGPALGATTIERVSGLGDVTLTGTCLTDTELIG